MRARTLAASSLALLLCLGLTACGDDDDDDASSSDTEAASSDTGDASDDTTADDSGDDATDETTDDGGDAISGDISDDCIEAATEFSEAFSSFDGTDLDSLGEIGDVFDELAGTFPDIEDELHTIADAYRDAADGDVSAISSEEYSDAATAIGEYFASDCGA